LIALIHLLLLLKHIPQPSSIIHPTSYQQCISTVQHDVTWHKHHWQQEPNKFRCSLKAQLFHICTGSKQWLQQ